MLIWAQLNLLAHFNEVEKVPIKRETLNWYIQILVDAKIVYRCQRFDMKSRKSLTREEKYYLADLGFYFAMNTDTRINYGPVLENVTYQYLRSKGYMVSVGRIGTLECDFVARRAFGDYFYIQVAMTIADRATEDRDVLRYTILTSLDSEDQEFLVDIESVYVDFGYPRDMEPII